MSSRPLTTSTRDGAASTAKPIVTRRRDALKKGVVALGVLAVVTLGACGQKGPLYRPDPNDPTKKRP